jgi:predicted transcriptional regulator of viral defense system
MISFAFETTKYATMSKAMNLQDWVNSEMIRGRYIFTKKDVLALQLPISEQAMQNSLNRLTERGIIMSPWQNFYVAIPTEYKLKGVVPPTFYIDRLMKFLGRDYYVSLLTAAAMNGAAHQRPMVFQVTVNGKPIRSGVKNGTQLVFTLRQDLPLEFTQQLKTQVGYMTVSGPELTALDIVAEEKKIGGLSRAAEVLVELSETTSWDESKLPLLSQYSNSTLQRLGYLLELIEAEQQADDLFALIKKTKKTLRKTPLKQEVPINEGMTVDKRWKIIENYKLEIDEI